MKNKLPSTFLLFVLACVLFMAAPSQAYMIYDVEAKYDDGFSYEFAFIVSGGVASFDESTEDKFFAEGDEWATGAGLTQVVILSFDQAAPLSLVFDFRVDFVTTSGRLFYQAVRVSNQYATVNLFDVNPDFGVLFTFLSGIVEDGLVVTARPTAAVPEPATLSLIAVGVAGLVLLRRRVQPQLEHVIPHGTNAANA